MITICLFLALSIVNAENDYQAFTSIKLPIPLMSAITAVYNDNLFVFGGVNTTSRWNNKFWKLPLDKVSLDPANDPPTDIITTLTNSDWVELTVTAPTYGDSTNNEFRCDGQCSVLIGQYLYIVGPYSSLSGTTTDPRTNIYRLDLAPATPQFANTSDFAYEIGYGTDARDACVTSAGGKMYIISGVAGSALSVEAKVYDPTNPLTPLADIKDLSNGRFTSGCAPNTDNDKIYLAGGRSQSFPAAPGIDTYDITANTWTNNIDNINDFDTADNNDNSRKQMKCFTNYKNTIECPGGFGRISLKSTSVIWNYNDRTNEYVNMETPVMNYALAVYEFYNMNNYRGSVALVIGGSADSASGFDTIDTIQYALRYALVTSAPTRTPSTSPTPAPTSNPLCEGCTASPTMAPVPTVAPVPTMTMTTEASPDDSSGGIKVNAFGVGIVFVVLSVLY